LQLEKPSPVAEKACFDEAPMLKTCNFYQLLILGRAAAELEPGVTFLGKLSFEGEDPLIC
jgi:hypothetical protein